MSQNDKPKLDELQKLLRRLERVELEKAERAAGEDAAAGGRVPATSSAPGGKGAPESGPVAGASTAAAAASGLRAKPAGVIGSQSPPASGEPEPTNDDASDKATGDREYLSKLQRGLEAPRSSGLVASESNKDAPGDTAKSKDVPARPTQRNGIAHDASGPRPAEAAPAAAGTASAGSNQEAANQPSDGIDKQHLSRMVYRGTAREIPNADPLAGEPPGATQRFNEASPGASSPDRPPFQLPAIPDSRSREITDSADEKARSGSSIGVVLVAAITAAVVSTVAAVLITIWVIRGGGLGSPIDPVLTASRTASPAADAAGTTASTVSTAEMAGNAAVTGAETVEPPAADPPPQAAEQPVTPSGVANSEATATNAKTGADDGTQAADPTAGPADAEVSAQTIAAAIASDEPAATNEVAGSPTSGSPTPGTEASSSEAPGTKSPDLEASRQDPVAETQESTSAPVDLAAITETAPEPDRSEMISAEAEREAPSDQVTPAEPPASGESEPELTSAELAEPSTSTLPPDSDQQIDQQTDPQPDAAVSEPPMAETGTAASTGNPDLQSDPVAATGPEEARSDALALNETQLTTAEPASPPASDGASGFTKPEPRAPYELSAPTQLKIAPDVSFEFPLRIEAHAGNLDNHFLIVSGLKRGARFSHGVELMFDTWQVQADKLDDLRLTIPSGFARELPLTIELRRPDGMTVVRTNLLLTAPGSAARLNLPEELYEVEATALPAAVLEKVRQGERAIDNGNLRGARLALQEAALQSSAVAALLLAMSYDPRHVEKFGVVSGSNTDVAAARQWYGRASSFGAEIATSLARGL